MAIPSAIVDAMTMNRMTRGDSLGNAPKNRTKRPKIGRSIVELLSHVANPGYWLLYIPGIALATAALSQCATILTGTQSNIYLRPGHEMFGAHHFRCSGVA